MVAEVEYGRRSGVWESEWSVGVKVEDQSQSRGREWKKTEDLL